MRSRSLVLFVSLALLTMGALAAQKAAKKAGGGAKPDASGFVGEHAEAAAAAPGPVHACLDLHNGGANFPINVTINPDVYPYPITGGVFSGNLCDAANWKITGGSLGASLKITATYSGTASCAKSVTITGAFNPPPSYIGSYTFVPPGTYKHHTLFLGYTHGSTACP